MSPLRGLLIVLVASAAAFLAAALLPSEDLVALERLPVKRVLACALAVNLAAVAVIVYHHIVVPSPPRLTMTMLASMVGLFGPLIAATSFRPDELSWTVNAQDGVAGFKLRYEGPNVWTAILGLGLLLFVGLMVYFYPEQYYRYQGTTDTSPR